MYFRDVQEKQNISTKEKRTAKEDDRSITSKFEIEVNAELWVREDPWMWKSEHLAVSFLHCGKIS